MYRRELMQKIRCYLYLFSYVIIEHCFLLINAKNTLLFVFVFLCYHSALCFFQTKQIC